jgi:hypothetical protein
LPTQTARHIPKKERLIEKMEPDEKLDKTKAFSKQYHIIVVMKVALLLLWINGDAEVYKNSTGKRAHQMFNWNHNLNLIGSLTNLLSFKAL